MVTKHIQVVVLEHTLDKNNKVIDTKRIVIREEILNISEITDIKKPSMISG